MLGRNPLREVIGTRRRLYVIGLALDFCVLDTAITAKTAGFGEVWIVLDLARAAHVGGFLYAGRRVQGEADEEWDPAVLDGGHAVGS